MILSSTGFLATGLRVGEIDHTSEKERQSILSVDQYSVLVQLSYVGRYDRKRTSQRRQMLRTSWLTTSHDTECANLPHQLSSLHSPQSPSMDPYRSSAWNIHGSEQKIRLCKDHTRSHPPWESTLGGLRHPLPLLD
jgi:hypothetical protein